MSEQPTIKKPNWFQRVFYSLWENPIVIKEMRASMRRRRTYVVFTIYLFAIASIISLVYFSFVSSYQSYPDPNARQQLGKGIFYAVVVMQMLAINFITPSLTANSITGERESLTYDLLRTTLISAKSIVLGKFLAGFLFTMLLVMGAFPLTGMAFLFGGVELPQFIISILMLVVTAALFSMIGVYFSSLAKNNRGAQTMTAILINLLTVGLPIFIFFMITLFSPWLEDIFDFLINGYGSLTTSNYVLGLLIVFIGIVLASSNPGSAAILTELLIYEEGAYFYFDIPFAGNTTIPFLSPWIGYLIFYSLLIFLFYKLAVNRVNKKDSK